MLLEYDMDDFIEQYLQQTIHPDKLNSYRKLWNVIFSLNMVYKNNNYFNIESMELYIKDIINDLDEEVSLKLDKISIYITDVIINYVNKYGFTLSKDILPYQMFNILESFYTILNIDYSMSDYILSKIENIDDSEPEEILARLLSEYTTLPFMVIYEKIDSVNDKFKYLNKYFQDRITLTNDNDFDFNTVVQTFIKADENLLNTKTFIKAIVKGYTPTDIEHLLTDMYSYLADTTDIAMVPYEIVVNLFLAVNTRENMEDGYERYINLDIIDILEDNSVKYTFVNEAVKNLIIAIREANVS